MAEFTQQCEDYIVVIQTQTKEADEQQQEVAMKSIKIREEETACKKLAALAMADLAEAMPAFEEAIGVKFKRHYSIIRNLNFELLELNSVLNSLNVMIETLDMYVIQGFCHCHPNGGYIPLQIVEFTQQILIFYC